MALSPSSGALCDWQRVCRRRLAHWRLPAIRARTGPTPRVAPGRRDPQGECSTFRPAALPPSSPLARRSLMGADRRSLAGWYFQPRGQSWRRPSQCSRSPGSRRWRTLTRGRSRYRRSTDAPGSTDRARCRSGCPLTPPAATVRPNGNTHDAGRQSLAPATRRPTGRRRRAPVAYKLSIKSMSTANSCELRSVALSFFVASSFGSSTKFKKNQSRPASPVSESCAPSS